MPVQRAGFINRVLKRFEYRIAITGNIPLAMNNMPPGRIMFQPLSYAIRQTRNTIVHKLTFSMINLPYILIVTNTENLS